MYLGKLVELADAEELFDRPRHPYTAALLSAATDIDDEATSRRILLRGDVPSPIEPPTGCRFHTRCPKARELCSLEEPPLEAKAGDTGAHVTACHFPVEAAEELAAGWSVR
jgi:oligopeptide/dipeptide ABC transporter ATP-binding protein